MKKERSCRTEKLLGRAAAEKLAASRVLLLGIGGVGGYAAEFLARSGVGAIVFVDGDRIEESNCNRQLLALTSTLGKFKAEVMAQRAVEINPDGVFTAHDKFLMPADVPVLLQGKVDLVVDCVDDTPVKVALISEARKRGIAVVSSMGAAGKCDPTQIEKADISRTHNCPLARAVRHQLKKLGITSGVATVFSPETPAPREKGDSEVPGSLSFVVAAFGAAVAACAVEKLLKRGEEK